MKWGKNNEIGDNCREPNVRVVQPDAVTDERIVKHKCVEKEGKVDLAHRH